MPSPLPFLTLNPIRDGAGRLRRRIIICVAALGLAALFAVPRNCLAQATGQCGSPYFESCTLNAGGGWAPVSGKDSNSLNSGWDFQAGGGVIMTGGAPTSKWSWIVNANFMFDQLQVSQSALQETKTLNPTNLGLQQASSATGKFYSATLDPLTFRRRVNSAVNVYMFGGFGWLRRSVDFAGVSVQGPLLQPNGPTVFGSGGNSGAYDAGGGASFHPHWLGPLKLYAEGRLLHGLAINRSTTLLPVSVGIRW